MKGKLLAAGLISLLCAPLSAQETLKTLAAQAGEGALQDPPKTPGKPAAQKATEEQHKRLHELGHALRERLHLNPLDPRVPMLVGQIRELARGVPDTWFRYAALNQLGAHMGGPVKSRADLDRALIFQEAAAGIASDDESWEVRFLAASLLSSHQHRPSYQDSDHPYWMEAVMSGFNKAVTIARATPSARPSQSDARASMKARLESEVEHAEFRIKYEYSSLRRDSFKRYETHLQGLIRSLDAPK